MIEPLSKRSLLILLERKTALLKGRLSEILSTIKLLRNKWASGIVVVDPGVAEDEKLNLLGAAAFGIASIMVWSASLNWSCRLRQVLAKYGCQDFVSILCYSSNVFRCQSIGHVSHLMKPPSWT